MKRLIKQYVSTGIKLPTEQVNKLPYWAKKTYFRQRIISVGAEERLSWDEKSAYKAYIYQNLSTKEEIINAIKAEYDTWGMKYVYKNLSDEWKIKYINLVISDFKEFNYDLYNISSDNVKKYYYDRVISEGLPIGGMHFMNFFPTPEDKDLYFNSLIINKRPEDIKWFESGMMSEETAVKFADMVIDQINKKGRLLGSKFKGKYYEITGNSLIRVDKKYVRRKGKVLVGEGLLGEEVNSYLNQNQTAEYLKLKNKKWVKVRAGLPRTNNDKEIVNSKGRRHGDIIKEEGVSYFEAIYSHNNGWLLIMNAIADYYEVAGKRPFYLIEGESIGKEGLSGEDLLDPNTVKVIGELNPDKIVEGNDLTTASGNEIDIRSMHKAGLLTPEFRGFEVLPSDERKLIYYSY